MTDMIDISRDTAADAVALVRLLRTNQPDMAMFIISTYQDKPDEMQALVASVAALANTLLIRIDSLSAELNRSADRIVPGADAVLASAAAAVVSFDPGKPA
jgi:hypothetical protein